MAKKTTKNQTQTQYNFNNAWEELLENKQVVYDMPEDYTGASVFTLKLFDNYKFVEEKK